MYPLSAVRSEIFQAPLFADDIAFGERISSDTHATNTETSRCPIEEKPNILSQEPDGGDPLAVSHCNSVTKKRHLCPSRHEYSLTFIPEINAYMLLTIGRTTDTNIT